MLYMIGMLYNCVHIYIYIYTYIYKPIIFLFNLMISSFADVDYIAYSHTHIVMYKYMYVCVYVFGSVDDNYWYSLSFTPLLCFLLIRCQASVRLHSRRDALLRTPCAG